MTDQLMDARLRAAGEAWRASSQAALDAPATSEPLDVLAAHPRRPRRLAWLVSAAVVAAALVAGGVYALQGSGDQSATGAVPLRGTVWRLVASGTHAAPDSLATLSIDKDGTLVADDGCTLFGVHVDVDHGQLFPSKFDVRDRDCTKQPGPVSFAGLVDTLTHFPAYSLSDDRLTIGSLRFVAAPLLPAPMLNLPTFAGAQWALVKAVDGQGHDHLVDGTAPTLQLKDEQLAVGDGCNTLTGPAYVDGQRVEWKQLRSGLVECSGIQPVVDAVFSRTSAEQRTSGTTLTISNASGTLTYQWVPSDKAATDPGQLTGKTWHLVSVAGEPPAGAGWLRVDGDRLTGIDGCAPLSGRTNLGSGALVVDRLSAEIPPTVSCAVGENGVARYLQQRPALWAIRGGELIIYGSGPQGDSLVFSLKPGGLYVTGWRLAGDRALSLVLYRTSVFVAAGTCEDSTGQARVSGSTIRFSGVHFVPTLCPGAPPPQVGGFPADAARVRTFLDGNVHWSISDGVLTLSKGGTTLTFTR